MGLVKRLTRHGNSVALIFDKALLELIGLSADAVVDISTADGQTLIVSPVQPPEQTAAVERSLKKLDQKFGEVFKKLAE